MRMEKDLLDLMVEKLLGETKPVVDEKRLMI